MYAKRIRGQMSESMLTAVFIILSGGLQDSIFAAVRFSQTRRRETSCC